MAIIIKNDQQIAGIRKSCQLAADTLDYLTQYIQPGVSTEAINAVAEVFIRDHGAIPAPLNYHGFPKSICTSINEVVCHGVPSEDEILKPGDIINIDVTTILDGYYGDTSTMYCLGEISDTATKLLAVTRDCLAIGISQVRPGNEFWQIGHAITSYAVRRGFSVVNKFCGHGTGIEFHEEPQVCHLYDPKERDTRKMVPGMIFTIEPMINQWTNGVVIDEYDKWTARTTDGGLSAQYEHTLLVVPEGVEVLTK